MFKSRLFWSFCSSKIKLYSVLIKLGDYFALFTVNFHVSQATRSVYFDVLNLWFYRHVENGVYYLPYGEVATSELRGFDLDDDTTYSNFRLIFTP